jgi:hypothetical protein
MSIVKKYNEAVEKLECGLNPEIKTSGFYERLQIERLLEEDLKEEEKMLDFLNKVGYNYKKENKRFIISPEDKDNYKVDLSSGGLKRLVKNKICSKMGI